MLISGHSRHFFLQVWQTCNNFFVTLYIPFRLRDLLPSFSHHLLLGIWEDSIQPTELTPWIGWVYTFPHYRGHRYAGKLLSYAETLAKTDGISIYISTNHNGLYEKYGYEFFEMMKDMHGEDSKVYVKYL